MNICRFLFCCAVAALAAGCSQLPRHEVDISGQLREQPIESVTLLPLVFPSALERNHPDDFPELLPENVEGTEAGLLQAFVEAFGASISVDSSFVPDRETLDWREKIGKELILGRVPLAVPPVDFGAESVLLISVIAYGSELNQYSYQLFPFLPGSKRRYFGRTRWDHVCDLEVLLIRPGDGHILCHVRHSERETNEERSDLVLGNLTAKTARVVAAALRADRGP